MSLGINNLAAVNTNAFVSGTDLAKASQALFAAASKVNSSSTAQTTYTKTAVQNSNSVNLFSADYNTIKQVATNKAGLGVDISSTGLSNIQALRAQAATANIAKMMEGKLYVPAEIFTAADIKESVFVSTKPQIFNTGDLEKDRKGSNPFSVFSTGKKEHKNEEVESLSIFA